MAPEMATIMEFTQQARQQREYQHREAVAQPTYRELAQRARRNREHTLRQQQLAQQARQDREQEPIARQPLPPQFPDTPSLRHQLGHCDILCSHCGASHWIEERVQGSAKSAPRFSSCCESGTIAMEPFQDPPQPLYSLLTDMTPSMFPHELFADNYQWPQHFVKTLEIITMPLHSVPLASNRICLFMALKAYIHSVFKANSVISLGHSFHCLEISQHSHRSTSMTQTQCNRHNSGFHIIMIYLM